MSERLAWLWCMVLCACLCGRVAAGDIYVSISTGSNKNPGTREAPKKLLWKVFKKIADGDHVYVAEGWYHGKSKSGVMPKCDKSNVTIEGGWNKDFSDRNPFKYLSIIGAPPDRQGSTAEVFKWEHWKGLVDAVTIDGFCIDRGGAAYYFGDGEPGARKRIEGHQDNTCWGYRNMNKGKSGSDPAIELLGKGGFTVRNCVIVNSPWWGIYVKAGGTGTKVTIENNLILISQGRGIEAITGGGWGKPDFFIKNNTVIFNNTLKTTEGRALSVDPRKGQGTYTIENNVLAFSDGGGITYKFKSDTMAINGNKFYFNRRGDACCGGTAVANAGDFEDELECDNEDNVRELPKLTAALCKAWVDRWSSREKPSLVVGNHVTEAELVAIREVHGMKEYRLPGYDKSFANYKSLPMARNGYTMSRYPYPMKKGESIEWARWVLPIVGADGEYGIQPFEGKPVWTEAGDGGSGTGAGGPTTVKMDVQFSSELLGKLEVRARAEGTSVKALIEQAVAQYLN